jgi:flagellar protein FlaG
MKLDTQPLNIPKPDRALAAVPLPEPAPLKDAAPSQPPPSRAEIARALEVASSELTRHASELNFSMDEASGELVVKIIDSRTREILRQMPSEEALKLARTLENGRQGALITARA